MLKKAFKKKEDYSKLILHSDQGWQYQHKVYQNSLNKYKVTQSMSRKGNSLDNGLIESFFGTLKTEMFYYKEDSFKDIKELKLAIIEYIDYYNNKRIKEKLKGLTPKQYRNQSL